MDVADQADFQRYALVEDVLCEIAKLHCLAVCNSDVVNEARAVPDAVRTAILDGLPDGFLAESLPCVNRDVEVLSLDVVKRLHMFLGRKTAFLACQIKPDHTSSAKIDGEFSHFEGDVHVAHGANDQTGANSEILPTALQSFEYRRYHLLVGQPFLRVKQGSESCLEVDHAVTAEVFRLLVGHTVEGLLGLHHGDGVCESFEVLWQASLIRAAMKPVRQRARIFSGEFVVIGSPRQFNHSCRP